MVTRTVALRCLCLCITTSRLQAFRPSLLVSLANSEPKLHCSSRTRLRMTSTSSDGVGQVDIGADSEDHTESPSGNETWRSLLEASSAKSRKIRGSNYVQLATVDPETQEPKCRCVVFRGFLKWDHEKAVECSDLPCTMRMCTDRRSQKVDQVMQHPRRSAEMVWWFAKTSEQYRISGELLFVGDGEFELDSDRQLAVARKEQWGNLSDAARESFLAESPPGDAFEEETTSPPAGGRDETGKVLPPPSNFLLMLLIPRHVDYLRLSNMYRQKDDYENGEWTNERLNP